MPKTDTTTRNRLLLTAILLAAIGIRIAYFLELQGTRLLRVPLLDAFRYHEWAGQLVAGDLGWGEPYWMGPLYPHLLAVVYWLGGAGTPAAQLIQWALTVVAIVLVYRIANRLLDPTPALLATALYAFYGPPVFYAGFLLMVTVLTILFLLAFWLCLRAYEKPTWQRFAAVGSAIGLAGLARGNVLILLVAVPALLWRMPLTGRRRLGLAAAVVLGGALMILPATVRNLVVSGDLVPLTSNGGINLMIGQQSQYGGIFGPVDKLSVVEFDPSGRIKLEAELGREVKPSEVSRIYTQRAVREFLARPGPLLVHTARKAYRFWSGYELPQIVAYDYWRDRSSALRLLVTPFTVLSAAGLLGMFRLRGRGRALLVVFVLAYFVSLLPFFPTARYRQPVAPLLAIAAAAYGWHIVRRWRKEGGTRTEDGESTENAEDSAATTWSHRWLRVRKPVLILLALTVVLLPGWSALDRNLVQWQVHLHEASRAAQENDRDAVIAALREAELVMPGNAETPYRLAGFLELLHDYAGALPALEEAERRLPTNRVIPYRVGRNLEMLQRYDEAIAAYERSMALDPTWGKPHFGRGMSHRKLGELPAAIAAMGEAVRLEPGKARYRVNLASLYGEAGQIEKAREILLALTRDFPSYINGWYNLSLLEHQAGNREKARQALFRAAGLRGATAQQREQIERLTALVLGAAGSGRLD